MWRSQQTASWRGVGSVPLQWGRPSTSLSLLAKVWPAGPGKQFCPSVCPVFHLRLSSMQNTLTYRSMFSRWPPRKVGAGSHNTKKDAQNWICSAWRGSGKSLLFPTTGGCCEEGYRLFSEVCSGKQAGNGHKLEHRKFWLDLKENIFHHEDDSKMAEFA